MNQKIRLLLIESARKQKPREYGELMAVIGLHHWEIENRALFSKILEDISRFEYARGKRPMLSAQVLYKGAKDIGKKFYWLANKLGHGPIKVLEERVFEVEMMQQCYEFWSNDQHYQRYRNDDGTQEAKPVNQILVKLEELPARKNGQIGDDALNQVGGIEIDWLEVTKENILLGNAGESLVIEFEQEMLNRAGQAALAKAVQKVPDGWGYDILSYYNDGRKKYIEVKTTGAGSLKPFPISVNEVAFSKKESAQYHLYRLFGFREHQRPIQYLEYTGAIDDALSLKPTQFLADRL